MARYRPTSRELACPPFACRNSRIKASKYSSVGPFCGFLLSISSSIRFTKSAFLPDIGSPRSRQTSFNCTTVCDERSTMTSSLGSLVATHSLVGAGRLLDWFVEPPCCKLYWKTSSLFSCSASTLYSSKNCFSSPVNRVPSSSCCITKSALFSTDTRNSFRSHGSTVKISDTTRNWYNPPYISFTSSNKFRLPSDNDFIYLPISREFTVFSPEALTKSLMIFSSVNRDRLGLPLHTSPLCIGIKSSSR
mmetsp:Transcript_33876/g.82135  ORF Transcript_33876/g.82135 Transcript_33876/m.82135 type:complete len:248 (-) Transcript_33876:1032-1775(-)